MWFVIKQTIPLFQQSQEEGYIGRNETTLVEQHSPHSEGHVQYQNPPEHNHSVGQSRKDAPVEDTEMEGNPLQLLIPLV